MWELYCAICMERIEKEDESGRPAVLPSCGHIFHSNCLRNLTAHSHKSRVSAACPTCRKDTGGYGGHELFPTEPPEEEEDKEDGNFDIRYRIAKKTLRAKEEELEKAKKELAGKDKTLIEAWDKASELRDKLEKKTEQGKRYRERVIEAEEELDRVKKASNEMVASARKAESGALEKAQAARTEMENMAFVRSLLTDAVVRQDDLESRDKMQLVMGCYALTRTSKQQQHQLEDKTMEIEQMKRKYSALKQEKRELVEKLKELKEKRVKSKEVETKLRSLCHSYKEKLLKNQHRVYASEPDEGGVTVLEDSGDNEDPMRKGTVAQAVAAVETPMQQESAVEVEEPSPKRARGEPDHEEKDEIEEFTQMATEEAEEPVECYKPSDVKKQRSLVRLNTVSTGGGLFTSNVFKPDAGKSLFRKGYDGKGGVKTVYNRTPTEYKGLQSHNAFTPRYKLQPEAAPARAPLGPFNIARAAGKR